jgi:putative hydrolase of the HAD superfamily
MERLAGVEAVLFDYGNTLVPYGKREDRIVVDAFHAAVRPHGAPEDIEAFREVVRSVTARLIDRATTTGREVRREEKVVDVLEALGLPAETAVVEEALEAITRAFVLAVRAPSGVAGTLERLAGQYRLGLLSNYFLAEPIHESLRENGLEGYLDPRIVSAEIGWCKPHARAYGPALAALDVPAERVLMVGDNLTADVGGAGALGCLTAHITEHLDGALPYGRPEGDGAEPTVRISQLSELQGLLLS